MIRNNLSTRPFYNERTVRLTLIAAAVVVGLVTVFNVSRVLYLSRSDTELATQATQDEASAAAFRADAIRLRASVDARQVEVAASEAKQANDLIDRRTFSWTELLNLFEATLPAEVRITSIRPRVGETGILLSMKVLGRGVPDIEEFMENLEATGKFTDILPLSDNPTDSGQTDADLQMVYRAGGAP